MSCIRIRAKCSHLRYTRHGGFVIQLSMWTLNDIHFPNGIALNKLGVVIGVREEHLGIRLAGTARVRCLKVWEIRWEPHDQLNKMESNTIVVNW